MLNNDNYVSRYYVFRIDTVGFHFRKESFESEQKNGSANITEALLAIRLFRTNTEVAG